VYSVAAFLMSTGRLFHRRGAATLKARSPNLRGQGPPKYPLDCMPGAYFIANLTFSDSGVGAYYIVDHMEACLLIGLLILTILMPICTGARTPWNIFGLTSARTLWNTHWSARGKDPMKYSLACQGQGTPVFCAESEGRKSNISCV